MAHDKPQLARLHELKPGQTADFYALLQEKTPGTTRDGKRFFRCRFKDQRRTVEHVVWADSGLYADCDEAWQAGTIYKIRGTYLVHDRYGPQIDVKQIRDIQDEDRDAGLEISDFYDRSRFDPKQNFADLRHIAEIEIADPPLRALTVGLLDAHAQLLLQLPASDRRFYPFAGGWLEHVLHVTQNCIWLADQYAARFPGLTPKLNRDLVVAGAILHDIGRAVELAPGQTGLPAEPTIAGKLIGHITLGRDMIRAVATTIHDLNPELILLLDHIVLSHLTLPEWGSPRLPMIPEVLILHHADDLDAKYEMFARCLTRDTSDGPFTDFDAILKKPLLKRRSV